MTLIELVRRRARALAGERSGATALEFAILAPVLFLWNSRSWRRYFSSP